MPIVFTKGYVNMKFNKINLKKVFKAVKAHPDHIVYILTNDLACKYINTKVQLHSVSTADIAILDYVDIFKSLDITEYIRSKSSVDEISDEKLTDIILKDFYYEFLYQKKEMPLQTLIFLEHFNKNRIRQKLDYRALSIKNLPNYLGLGKVLESIDDYNDFNHYYIFDSDLELGFTLSITIPDANKYANEPEITLISESDPNTTGLNTYVAESYDVISRNELLVAKVPLTIDWNTPFSVDTIADNFKVAVAERLARQLELKSPDAALSYRQQEYLINGVYALMRFLVKPQ